MGSNNQLSRAGKQLIDERADKNRRRRNRLVLATVLGLMAYTGVHQAQEWGYLRSNTVSAKTQMGGVSEIRLSTGAVLNYKNMNDRRFNVIVNEVMEKLHANILAQKENERDYRLMLQAGISQSDASVEYTTKELALSGVRDGLHGDIERLREFAVDKIHFASHTGEPITPQEVNQVFGFLSNYARNLEADVGNFDIDEDKMKAKLMPFDAGGKDIVQNIQEAIETDKYSSYDNPDYDTLGDRLYGLGR